MILLHFISWLLSFLYFTNLPFSVTINLFLKDQIYIFYAVSATFFKTKNTISQEESAYDR